MSLNQNQIDYLPIRLLRQSQTVVKPKPKPESNCLITIRHSIEDLSVTLQNRNAFVTLPEVTQEV